jgi:hypothetical protein
MQGRQNVYSARLLFRKRGEYRFTLTAYEGDDMVETYERRILAAPQLAEGSRLELDAGFLARLSSDTGGMSVHEAEVAELIDHVRSLTPQRVLSSEKAVTHSSPWFAVAFLGVLVVEWIVRRMLNLF